MHLPLVFALQYLLMDQDWHWTLNFALSAVCTMALCLVSYQGLVRHTPLRRFLG